VVGGRLISICKLDLAEKSHLSCGRSLELRVLYFLLGEDSERTCLCDRTRNS